MNWFLYDRNLCHERVKKCYKGCDAFIILINVLQIILSAFAIISLWTSSDAGPYQRFMTESFTNDFHELNSTTDV